MPGQGTQLVQQASSKTPQVPSWCQYVPVSYRGLACTGVNTTMPGQAHTAGAGGVVEGSAGAFLVPVCASLLQGLGVHRREHYDAWPGHAAGAGGVVEGSAGAFLVPVCASLLQGFCMW